jgi:hypothetical protein
MTVQRWEAVIASIGPGALEEDSRRTLCAVLGASNRASRYERTDRPGGLPSGHPPTAVTRSAAARLLADPRVPNHPLRSRELAIAHAYRWSSPGRDVDELGSVAARHLESCRRGLHIALEARDEDGALYLGRLVARAAYAERQWQLAHDTLVATWQPLPPIPDESDERMAFWPSLTGQESSASRKVWRLKQRSSLGRLAGMLTRTATFPDLRERGVREVEDAAEALIPFDSSYHAKVLQYRGVRAREVGDRDQYREIERELEAIYRSDPRREVLHHLMLTRVANAQALHDQTRVYHWATLYCHALTVDPDRPLDESAVPDLALIASRTAELHELGARESLRVLGNNAYDAAAALVRGGRTALDPEARDAAAGWLDVATDAWREFGSNGLLAAEFSRVRLAWSGYGGPAISRESAIDRLLVVIDAAIRGGLRRNATRFLASIAPGDARAEALLRAEIAAAEPRFRGETRGALAAFLAADAPPGDLERWREIEELSLGALDDLRAEGFQQNPTAAAGAARTAADAIERLEPDRAVMIPIRLERLLIAIDALGVELLGIATEAERLRVRATNLGLVSAAADAAVEQGDVVAADIIMETMRRERVGILLARLSSDPAVSDVVRAHAERVRALTLLPKAPPRDPGADDGTRSAIVRDSATLRGMQRAAGEAAEAVLGPLSALSGTSIEIVGSVDAVLRAIGERDGVVAVLQLALVDDDLDDDDVRVLRRLCIRGPGVDDDLLDIVETTRSLIARHPTEPGYFGFLPALAQVILPPRLVEVLLSPADDVPSRLLIVPTGMHAVPFDALPISQDELLLDRAVVTVHTSLTTIVALADIHARPSHTHSTAVFDLTLQHAGVELESLRRHVAIDARPQGVTELREALHAVPGLPGGVLAMAVHGASSPDGWQQTKQLPDGNVLHPADLMGWEVPRLCVLASCHSSIVSGDGVELSGFPVAMFLSGATTVVGSLLAVPDASTSEIMVVFWELLGREGRSAPEALREAKLQWMSSGLARKRRMRDWAGLVVYGGAHD